MGYQNARFSTRGCITRLYSFDSIICNSILRDFLERPLSGAWNRYFKVIAIPFGFVANLTNSWLGLVVIYLLTQALWIVGIHGANIIFAFINPIALANMSLNVAGERMIVAGEFSNMFVIAGGSGATLGLCIWLATRARSEQLSAIGKASIVPYF